VEFDVQHHTRTLASRVPAHVRVGPFVCRFNPSWSSPFANYAVPDDHAEPSREDISALISAFRQQDRKPRLEYLPGCAPAVEKALLAMGFEVENRAPVMACGPRHLEVPDPVPGLEFREARSDDDLDELFAIQHRAFEEPGDPEPGAGSSARRIYQNGGIVVRAMFRGETAGGGSCTAPVDGITELVGVAVADRFRRRGIGAAISAYLTSRAHHRGYHLVWLEPADDSVERIYAGIGYRTVGEKLNISLPGVWPIG